jgi:1-deoxy-D-xylulose-5-phosphate reductoisomerase
VVLSSADAAAAAFPSGVAVLAGPEALAETAAAPDVDLVVNAVVGRAGLEASLAALRAGKLLALANKESLVVAGELLAAAEQEGGGTILPVDSEHSGLFQCLDGRDPAEVRRLVLTASGGPFRGRRRAELEAVTPEQALRHPVWAMGPRITVDSATLMNKGLEVIETHWLFGVPYDRIDVWIHPESVVHALVETADGAHIAQLSTPDMALPVQYAMSYPERWDAGVAASQLPRLGTLHFEEPDPEAFPALRLAYETGRQGGTAPAVLNAADEVAVEAFLAGRLGFLDMTGVIECALDAVAPAPLRALDDVIEADRRGREAARRLVDAR